MKTFFRGILQLIEMVALLSIVPLAVLITWPLVFLVAGAILSWEFMASEVFPGYKNALKEVWNK